MSLETLWAAIAGGISYGLLGFGKAKDEPFDWVKFLTDIIIGVLLGLGELATGLDFGTLNGYFANFGATAIISSGLKAIYRRLIKPNPSSNTIPNGPPPSR